MYISSVKISNYKSYFESEEIELNPGFNIVVGKNNAGKSSLLNAIGFNTENKFHVSIHNKPTEKSVINYFSKFEFLISLSKEELINIFRAPKVYFPEVNGIPAHEYLNQLNNMFNNSESFTFSISLNYEFPNSLVQIKSFESPDSKFVFSSQNFLELSFDSNSQKFQSPVVYGDYNSSLSPRLYGMVKGEVYRFNAERFNIGQCPVGANANLKADASNLPEVLNLLQGNKVKFERYNRYVNQVFSEIKRVSVQSRHNNKVEILTWSDDNSEREDLAISLSQSGTGIGQVLAILYVVLQSRPQIIIIDEPQSFLHPGATRKLVEILKQNPHHQYILATHSATILSSANPATITLVTHGDSRSHLLKLDKGEASSLKLILDEVGAKLSDVFGADNILWVEGPTEEKCFPLIVEAMGMSLMATNIVGVVSTGDFEGRSKKIAYEIYQRLSDGNALIPPASGFVFDREGRSQHEIDDMNRQSKGKVHFIKRRLYENYLLNPSAIEKLVNEIEGFSESKVTVEEIEKWIDKNRRESHYWKGNSDLANSDNWEMDIHGAKLLQKLFSDLSSQKVEYQKTRHSVRLTEIIIEDSFGDFKELQELLSPFCTII